MRSLNKNPSILIDNFQRIPDVGGAIPALDAHPAAEELFAVRTCHRLLGRSVEADDAAMLPFYTLRFFGLFGCFLAFLLHHSTGCFQRRSYGAVQLRVVLELIIGSIRNIVQANNWLNNPVVGVVRGQLGSVPFELLGLTE